MGARSQWFTAAEIARLRLPGLPADPRRVREVAATEGWSERKALDATPLARPRAARGGGTEYHASLLPVAAQERLREVTPAAPIAPNDTGHSATEVWEWFDRQTASVKDKARMRLTILQEAEERARLGEGKTAARAAVASQHGISPRAIANWFALVADVAPAYWLAYLAPKYKGGRAHAEIDAEAWLVLMSDYLRLEKPSFASCYRRVVERFAKPRGITLPSAETLRRRMDREVSRAVQTRLREGEQAFLRTIPPQPRKPRAKRSQAIPR